MGASECVDYQIIYARGSGQEQDKSAEYVALREAIRERFLSSGSTYELADLDYPAQKINLRTGLGAFVSAGRSMSYGKSVRAGVMALAERYRQETEKCPNVRFVMVGYSQGAQVVGTMIRNAKPDNIEYVALFGDPELYLPESQNSAACRGESLSGYRADVEDCRVESGILGARLPYVPDGFDGKVGAWCNDGDIVCGSGHD